MLRFSLLKNGVEKMDIENKLYNLSIQELKTLRIKIAI